MRPSEPKKEEIIVGEPVNRLSNKPSQSVEIVEGVASVKDRMRTLTMKKEMTKENTAAKEIRQAGTNSVKDLALTLNGLGLFAPKIKEQPIEEIQQVGLEQTNEAAILESQGLEEEKKISEQLNNQSDFSTNVSIFHKKLKKN